MPARRPARRPEMGAARTEENLLEQAMTPFRAIFTAPTWRNALALTTGALLSINRRTTTQALRAMDLADGNFSKFHRLLSRARWSSREAAKILLELLVEAFVPAGPVIVGVDDTIERRWGPKIAARGIYRDPVRSTSGLFVKASGLRWLSLQGLAPVPWTKRGLG